MQALNGNISQDLGQAVLKSMLLQLRALVSHAKFKLAGAHPELHTPVCIWLSTELMLMASGKSSRIINSLARFVTTATLSSHSSHGPEP